MDNYIFKKEFWLAVLVRAVRTFAEGMLAALGTNLMGITSMDWIGAASIGASAALVSVIAAVATGLPETPVAPAVPKLEDTQKENAND